MTEFLSETYSLLLKAHHRICVKVGQIDLFPLLFDVRVFAHKKPSHMREEEATFSIVWIGVSFCKLVVHSVVSAPFYYITLWK